MTKKELAAVVAAKTKLKKANAEKYTNAVVEAMQETLAKGEDVSLIGFGTFSVVERPAREGRNPATGKKIKIKAKKAVKFKAGKSLKEAVEG